jgi:hypothetical protein
MPKAMTSPSKRSSSRMKASSGPDRSSHHVQDRARIHPPDGYLDAEGTLHREGTMRLATARTRSCHSRIPGCRRTRPTWPSSCSPGWSPAWVGGPADPGGDRGPFRRRPRVPAAPI